MYHQVSNATCASKMMGCLSLMLWLCILSGLFPHQWTERGSSAPSSPDFASLNFFTSSHCICPGTSKSLYMSWKWILKWISCQDSSALHERIPEFLVCAKKFRISLTMFGNATYVGLMYASRAVVKILSFCCNIMNRFNLARHFY